MGFQPMGNTRKMRVPHVAWASSPWKSSRGQEAPASGAGIPSRECAIGYHVHKTRTPPTTAGRREWTFRSGWPGRGNGAGRAAKEGKPLLWIETPSRPAAVSRPAGKGEIAICALAIKSHLRRSPGNYDPAAERILLSLPGR